MPIRVQNFVGGEFVQHESQEYLKIENPATLEHLLDLPKSNANDGVKAIDAAEKAFSTWSKASPKERSDVLLRIADLIEQRLDEFAAAESADQGKSVRTARTIDIPRAVANFRFFAQAILHEVSDCTHQTRPRPGVEHQLNFVQRMPVGVSMLIAPWNLPIYLLSWKIAPCIAYGNTCICKASQFTSLTAFLLAKVIKDALVPAGVVNFVFGSGRQAAQPLMENPRVKLISFTGSTEIGKVVAKCGATGLKKVSLELGGKNAAIVFADCDIEKAARVTAASCFTNQGEVCLTTERVYVQRPIFKEFVNKLVTYTKNMFPVGDPSHPDTTFGALCNGSHYSKVTESIETAIANGAHVEYGWKSKNEWVGQPVFRDLPGYFVPPTILTNLDDSFEIAQEEVFGPIACVIPFDNEDDVIRRANSLDYGLAGTLHTENATRMHRVAAQLEVGTLWVNSWLVRDLHMPFGGFKASGSGREGFKDSEEFFTEAKCVSINY